MRETIPVTRTGHMAYDQLSSRSKGAVYAVFNSTFYLKANHRPVPKQLAPNDHSVATAVALPLLVCIGPADLPAGPINVNATLRKLPAPRVGDTWHSNQNIVTIGRVRLDLTHTNIWRPGHRAVLRHPLHTSTDTLAQIVGSTTPPQQSLNKQLNTRIQSTLAQSLEHLLVWLKGIQQSCSSASFPNTLIGCGGGLTPAGDDSLVGVLVALSSWNMPQLQPLITEVHRHLSLTSELSAAHLLAACKGSAVEPLHKLIDTLSCSAANPADQKLFIEEAAKELGEYGDSSGYFALRGVLIAAQIRTVTESTGLY